MKHEWKVGDRVQLDVPDNPPWHNKFAVLVSPYDLPGRWWIEVEDAPTDGLSRRLCTTGVFKLVDTPAINV